MQFILSNFVDRLEEQMILNDLTNGCLAEKIHIDKSTVASWRRGECAPSAQNFVKLVEFLRCSADYLLGLVEFPNEQIIYSAPVCAYGRVLRNLLSERNLSQENFRKHMEISSYLLHKWLTDKNAPSVENLVRIASFFEISVDMLLQRVK